MLDQVLKESKQYLNESELPIMAIDYGEVRIGLAVSDTHGRIGSPIGIITRSRKKKVDTVISEIIQIANEYGVKSFLLGVPYAFEESHKEIQSKIEAFSNRLAQISKKKIYYYTETYSSEEATQFLGEYVATGTRDGKIDKMSAAIFLQNFLDARTNNKNKHSKPRDRKSEKA